ncbi:hypothetical protein Golax_003890 [Gossypium laxum]|uniref:DUF7745 domain-containing protein n=1 Tax=Gossypium laxum TaxID=34288 RepID=A0A7J9AH32_9ROSI|nr:hypothetical protein [Gossypium laxum]
MDCRRNREDELKGIWQSWDEAKKTRFQDKYGNVAQLLFVKPDDALLKAMVHFWDPTYRCFTFNEVDMFDIRDAMGKASSNRHLALFAFAIYGLIVFPKALGYMSIELADFLLQIKKGVIPSPAVLVETIISLKSIKREGDGQSEWPPNQLIEEWFQNLSTLTYQEIEWRAPWMIRSTILIECGGYLWVPLIGIWGAISYSSLMVLSQYGYDQYVLATTRLNRVEALVQDP